VNSRKSEFSRVYRNNFESVILFIRKSIGNNDDANDLTQEVFTLYFTKKNEGAVIPNPSTWLHQTAQYYIRNYQREIWHADVDHDVDLDTLLSTDNMNILSYEARWLLDDILLLDMTDPLRTVFINFGICQNRMGDIAHDLGMSIDQVKRSYQKACKIIRLALSKNGITTIKELL
jgi:RNA polymerase sigma factor (sigma-70 family)